MADEISDADWKLVTDYAAEFQKEMEVAAARVVARFPPFAFRTGGHPEISFHRLDSSDYGFSVISKERTAAGVLADWSYNRPALLEALRTLISQLKNEVVP